MSPNALKQLCPEREDTEKKGVCTFHAGPGARAVLTAKGACDRTGTLSERRRDPGEVRKLFLHPEDRRCVRWRKEEKMAEEKQKTRLMTTGPIMKQLILFSLPLMAGNIFQMLYNTVDSIVVGNFVYCHPSSL